MDKAPDTYFLRRYIKLVSLVVYTEYHGLLSDPIRMSDPNSFANFENFNIFDVIEIFTYLRVLQDS